MFNQSRRDSVKKLGIAVGAAWSAPLLTQIPVPAHAATTSTSISEFDFLLFSGGYAGTWPGGIGINDFTLTLAGKDDLEAAIAIATSQPSLDEFAAVYTGATDGRAGIQQVALNPTGFRGKEAADQTVIDSFVAAGYKVFVYRYFSL